MFKAGIDIHRIRKAFPILEKTVNGKPLIYFDSGATSQKPLAVINALVKYYREQNANIHRGVHTLSQEITTEYEAAREAVQKHLNAAEKEEIIFTSGTTASINLVADTFGKRFFQSGGKVLVTQMEHHSNILPWQKLVEEKGGSLLVVPVKDDGTLDLAIYKKLLREKPLIAAFTHVSNTLGTVNPVREMIADAHELGIPVLVDGAQAVPHLKVDVRELDADFYCFSAHKVYGPTGIGILYGKRSRLEALPNYQVGGGTIRTVTMEKTLYADLPLRFEAGTPHIEGVVGLKAALDWLNELGLDVLHEHEMELLGYATEKLSAIRGLRILGSAVDKAGVISFTMDGIHPYDAGMILDKLGIAVRTGHHCTQPLMDRYGIAGTIRMSLAAYNTKEEIHALIKGVEKVKGMLS